MLGLTNQALLMDGVQRGLSELKIERALTGYAQGGIVVGAAAHQVIVGLRCES